MRVNWRSLIPERLHKMMFGEKPKHSNIYRTLFGSGYHDQTLGFLMNRFPLWHDISVGKPDRVMEIGLGHGVNAMVMMALSDCEEYYCFDWLNREESIKSLKLLENIDNFYLYEGDTLKTLPRHVDELPDMDLVFIDGGYQYEVVKNDWKYSKRLMHDKTVVWFHDYGPTARRTGDVQGVCRAVSEIDGSEFEVEMVETPDVQPDYARVRKRERDSP